MRRGLSVIGEEVVNLGAGVISLAFVVYGWGAEAAPRGGHWTAMLTNPLEDVIVTGSAREVASVDSTVAGWIWM